MDPTEQKSINRIKVTVDGGLLRETRQGSRGVHKSEGEVGG